MRNLLLALAVALVAGCCPNNDSARLAYNLRFVKAPPNVQMDTVPGFHRIYAIGGRGNLYDTARGRTVGSWFYLVYDYNADKTTFLFESPGRTDTLTVAYTRNVRFISRNCGAELTLRNLRIIEPTSFQNARVENDYNIVVTL
ncbi:MAG: DUF6452 family protein [Cytophagales bacterium]|nr:DUF6452 family protein [Cytophagales bacterium]